MNKSEAGKLGWIASRKKQEENYKQRIDKYFESPALCKECNFPIAYKSRKNKFCNHSCSAKYNNTTRKKIGYCKNCNKELDFSKQYNKTYCNGSCFHEHQWSLRKQEIIESGEAPHIHTAKRFLRETRGARCEICKNTEWMGQPIPLIMDHINGNSDDNRLANLRLVCGNCDMQLPTYKAKNLGNGRHYRKQRYKEGKSY